MLSVNETVLRFVETEIVLQNVIYGLTSNIGKLQLFSARTTREAIAMVNLISSSIGNIIVKGTFYKGWETSFFKFINTSIGEIAERW